MSKAIESKKLDRTHWGSGEWDNEPDRLEWRDPITGLPCLIVRGPCGQLCGYVAVTSDHPWYGKGYDDVPAEVHGGLTYANKCAGHICHVPKEGESDDVWWLGFDCAHCGDYCPSYGELRAKMNLESFTRPSDTYRNVAYVKAECASLALQVKAVAEKPSWPSPR